MSTRWTMLVAPSERAAEVIGLLLIGIGFAIDALTGPNYSNLLFYIPPLTYVAWFSGSRVGWTYVCLVAVIILVVHFLESAEIDDVYAADYNALTRIVTTVFVYWTVHTLRRAVVALRDANQRLARLNEQKNLLFAVISHDLTTPFNAILGYAELLEHAPDPLPAARLRDYAGSLGEAARRAFDLLGNLLQWARLQMERAELQPGDVEVRLLLERAVDEQRPAATRKAIELVVEPAPAGLHLHADGAAAQTILRNLLGNAVKFTPAGGRITVGVGVADGMVAIAVTDTGVGMSESRRLSLFDPGARRSTAGTEEESGAGIGLILCQDLAERSGGRLAVESAPGQGSRFTVTLPRGPQGGPAGEPALPALGVPIGPPLPLSRDG